MSYDSVLNVGLEEWFEFYTLVATKLYEDTELEGVKFNEYIRKAVDYAPLPLDGSSTTYFFTCSHPSFDQDKDWSEETRFIESQGLFKLLSTNQCVKEAFKIYSKLPEPEEWSDSFDKKKIKSNKSFYEENGMEGQFEIWLKNHLKTRPAKMNLPRFCGFVAMNYMFYIHDQLNQSLLYENKKTPSEVKDILLGKDDEGVLPTLIELVNSGYGLLDSSANIVLQNHLSLLYSQIKFTKIIPDINMNKHFLEAKKRFVIRLGSRILSIFKYEEESNSQIELMIYHLLVNIVNPPRVNEVLVRDSDLKKEVSRHMKHFYSHRTDTLKFMFDNDLEPPLEQ